MKLKRQDGDTFGQALAREPARGLGAFLARRAGKQIR
jgi:hypothetical protein